MIVIKPYCRKAQYYETDQMGIIHHSNYIRWFEEARLDYMEQLGYNYRRATEAGIDFAVLQVQCEYKSMVRFGETVEIYMTVTEISAARMAISYEVVDIESGVLRTRGESQHCFFHNQRGRPVSLLKELPELYRLFLEQNAKAVASVQEK